ncbi:MAG: hypothetical protein AB1916_09320 [Thermodesulfobacteriota bacterium]
MPIQRPERKFAKVIMALSDGTIVEGTVHLGIGEYNTRVSDLLKGEEDFLTITDVTSNSRDIDRHGDILFVNKTQVVWVIPEGD